MKSVVVVSLFLLIIGTSDLFIVLEDDGGYSNILVAISENTPQPSDGGFSFIENLKELLTESSKVLYQATGSKVYFKNISILIPPKWIVEGTPSRLSSNQADIRLNPTGSLPYTLHSGKCGVAGNFITLPVEYVDDSGESLVVRAKGIIQQWAQFRYGVFEEHGYPDDSLLPYFYRHPDGYDAVTSSNNTFINGDLKSLSGGDCNIDENGTISDQKDCRFIPSPKEQTATSSLMSFYWLESVTDFSNKPSHDRRPPHRQNRLCGSRSSWEVILQSPDLNGTQPNPDQDPKPQFRLLQNPKFPMFPVVYLAIDTSKPSSTYNAGKDGLNILKQGLRSLFNYFSSYPDLYVAWSTFENIDSEVDRYLKEEVPPTRFEEGEVLLLNKVEKFNYSSVVTRDVSAVIRDAERRLRIYKDIGGSILYIITSTGSVTNNTVIETDMAERLLLNNIKLVVAESGPIDLGKALYRFSVLSQGSYYFQEKWESNSTFPPIDKEIEVLCCRAGLKNERRTITSRKDLISIDNQWTGTFTIDSTVGTNTTIVLRSPTEGLFTITLTKPDGQQIFLNNEPEVTNWNIHESNISVTWKRIPGLTVVGRWNYAVNYNATCDECETETEIHLQIGSSKRNSTSNPLPTFYPWVSLTAGLKYVDYSKNPSIIQAKFESVNGRIGDLVVTADIILDSDVLETVNLTDTGKIDSDISKDGIYSGIFYPVTNGNYTVNYRAVSVNYTSQMNKSITPDQDDYCCGSLIPTATLVDFQMTANEALNFEVRNVNESTPQEYWPIVSDFQAETYGVDQDNVYVALTWTVPLNTASQVVRYSEDYTVLLDAIETANETQVIDGSLENIETGTSVFVFVAVPYNHKNVYFAVEITGSDGQKTRSHITWTEPNPPEYIFTTTDSTTMESTSEASSLPSTEESSETSSSISSESPSTFTTEDTSSTDTDTTTETTVSNTDNSTQDSSSDSTTDPSTTTENTSSSSTFVSTTTDTTITNPTKTDCTTTLSTTTNSTTTDSTTSLSTTTVSTTTVSTTSPSTTTASTTTVSTTSPSTTTVSTTSPSTTTASTTTVSTTSPSTTTVYTTTDSTTSVSTTIDSTTTNPTTSVFTTIDSTTTNPTMFVSTTTDSTTTATTGSTTPYPDENDGDGLTSAQIGYIIGGTVGGIVVIAIIVSGLIYLRKKQNVSSLPEPAHNNNQQSHSGTSSIASTGRFPQNLDHSISFTFEENEEITETVL